MTDIENIEIIFENDDLAVVNKPAGLVVHADGRTNEPNLCDWILQTYPETEGVGEPIEQRDGTVIARPGIVHRLDRDTSGALIIARTNEAHAYLKTQFKDRAVKKEYNAFVYGRIDTFRLSIDEPIGRSAQDFRRWTIGSQVRGKARPAHTDVTTVTATDAATFIKAFPKTGRTHQIRVHLQSVRHPVVCDDLYATGRDCLLGFDRQALHARSVTFRLLDETEITAEAAYPADFRVAIENLEKSV
ncbi:MAG: RluA family pseudouridine synthase [Candidatus Paceibacterota bacterium]